MQTMADGMRTALVIAVLVNATTNGSEMQPYVNDKDFILWCGDVREVLPTLEPESVDCALTSPPFYGLRDYGTGSWEGGDPDCDHLAPPSGGPNPERYSAGGGEMWRAANDKSYRDICGKCGARRVDRQIGLEASPDEWCAELVAVFREVRRVLKPQATLWIEIGDSYAQYDGQGNKDDPREPGLHGAFRMSSRLSETAEGRGDRHSLPSGFKRKDLLGAPWLLAFALRADGWYLRQCIIWQKPNPMPESVRDRCTTAHSYLFLLSKQPRYFFDAEAIAEPSVTNDPRRPYTSNGSWQIDGRPLEQRHGGELRNGDDFAAKNARSVWSIPTEGFSEAHFATFPQALVERIIKAGCPESVCVKCGKPRERIVEKESRPNRSDNHGKHDGTLYRTVSGGVWNDRREVLGEAWSDCGCGAGFTRGVCLDPFMGSGTTALVARRLGRRSVGVELNAEYAAMAARRLQQLSLLAEAPL